MLAPLKDEGLVDAVDAFCEKAGVGFSPAQTGRVYAAADAGDGEAALEDLHGRLVHDLELRVDEDRQR